MALGVAVLRVLGLDARPSFSDACRSESLVSAKEQVSGLSEKSWEREEPCIPDFQTGYAGSIPVTRSQEQPAPFLFGAGIQALADRR